MILNGAHSNIRTFRVYDLKIVHFQQCHCLVRVSKEGEYFATRDVLDVRNVMYCHVSTVGDSYGEMVL